MPRSWADPRELDDQERERREACGLSDPHRADWQADVDDWFDRRDRVLEYARQPHARERREHLRGRQQERDARLALYPQRGATANVTPLGRAA